MNELKSDGVPLVRVSNDREVSYKAHTLSINYFNANKNRDCKASREIFIKAFIKGYEVCKKDIKKFLDVTDPNLTSGDKTK